MLLNVCIYVCMYVCMYKCMYIQYLQGLCPSRLSTTNHASSSQNQSYVTTDGQSASLSWNKAPIWGLGPDLYYTEFPFPYSSISSRHGPRTENTAHLLLHACLFAFPRDSYLVHPLASWLLRSNRKHCSYCCEGLFRALPRNGSIRHNIKLN
jgi:hypothetical protein